jgi:MFS family permease
VIFSLVGQIAWVVENMYFNVFIYKMFNASASDISFMVSASAISATLTTILVGAFSDKVGKRKAFICGGYILWGASILSFALIRTDVIGALFPMATSVSAICVTLVVIMACVMTFFGSSANDACFNAWLTDSTDNSNRGAAEGINAMMPLVAILAVFGGFMSFDLSLSKSWTTIFLVIGVSVIIIGIAGIFLIKDVPISIENNKSYFANIFYGFRPSVVRKNPLLYLHLLSFAVFGIAIQIFMPYLILYYTVALKMDDYVLVMAPAIILAAVFTAIWGRVYDRIHFKKSIIPTVVLLAAGFVLLIVFRAKLPVFIGSLLMMCGYL